jgi:hypothetical protein
MEKQELSSGAIANHDFPSPKEMKKRNDRAGIRRMTDDL